MDAPSLPTCLGFIMDGNRRFAKAQHLPAIEGHRQGFERVFVESVEYFRDVGTRHLVYFAFSTENWQRQESEVTYLLTLFKRAMAELEKKFLNDPVLEKRLRVRFVGRREDFSLELQNSMNMLEEKSVSYGKGTTIWIALSYGGRAEIVAAVNAAVAKGETIDEQTFGALLWSAELPEPDMIVRTSGEQRLSNFLTWKSVYSELYFIKKPWPALTKIDFEDILKEYGKRQRRLGK
ncbi:MAG: polyprenyl diphosphate synthase [Patescibacteria group bacterium]